MRLSSIKLAGFKSFVEPTTIALDDDLTAVVGPNGCGKSNVIDAVRWVIGESSARQLRGQSLEDVIFAGSKTRQPVGRAVVELIFDNSDGQFGGSYAGFAEISIQREHSRRTGSKYRINGTRARRRDVQDLFFGTGLGGRASYALIGQGAVNRLIDARPEQIRDLLEEAAGISKYKERRRETENRISHTRDNLERLQDRIGETAERVETLASQAEAARDYQRLQTEQQRLRRGQLVLRWRYWRDRADAAQAEQQRQRQALGQYQADKHQADQELAQTESDRQSASDVVDAAQAAYYDAQAEAQRVAQAIEHARQWREQRDAERNRLVARAEDLTKRLEDARAGRQDKAGEAERLVADQPTAVEAEQQAAAELERAEAGVQRAERDRDALFDDGNNPQRDLESAERRQAEAQNARNNADTRLASRQAELDAVEVIDRTALADEEQSHSARRQSLDADAETRRACAGELDQASARIVEWQDELESARDAASALRAQLAAETRMKNVLTGGDDEALNDWLGSDTIDPVADHVVIEREWQLAVERALGDLLRSRLVDNLSVFGDRQAPPNSLRLMVESASDAGPEAATATDPNSLAARMTGPASLRAAADLLFPIADVPSALARRQQLADHQQFITPAGALIGRHALSLPGAEAATDSALHRERAIQALTAQLTDADERTARAESELGRWQQTRDEQRQRLATLDESLDERRQTLQTERAELDDRYRRADRAEARRDELASELSQGRQAYDAARADIEQAGAQITELRDAVDQFQVERDQRQSRLTGARETRDRARQALTGADKHRREIETRASRAEAEHSAAQTRVTEAERARDELGTQLAAFDAEGGQDVATPDEAARQTAEVEQQSADTRLKEARRALESADSARAEARDSERALDDQVSAAREADYAARTDLETAAARRDGFAEQLAEIEATAQPAVLAADMPDEAEAESWQKAENKISRQIESLGNVNLAAIDEHAEAEQQQRYLNEQYADLDQALATLNEAIDKIDRETRSRLKTTFDQVNEHFAAFFSELFGGGEAALERTESDWLATGVQVIARPPGKSRVALAMLSGGEKTLTALALLFALFELNPAPFCMLDEVDAPLDDANVERFCELVTRMAKRLQFVVITHNKTTMECPRTLHGVTMAEPGVSRLVRVDVDEALAMAESSTA